MTTILYSDPELLIALNKKIIFVNPNDLQIFKNVEIPEDLTKCGLKEENNDYSSEQVKQQSTTSPQQETPMIQHVCLSPNNQLLAVTTSGQKALILYQCRPENAKLISVRSLSRTSSAITFSNDSKILLVTDKTGDCYLYDCEDSEKPPQLLLGHLSVVYDILWTKDSKYIITCDRDDKIRVTNYPETYDIHVYCLGHKEFVSGIKYVSDQVIVSVSGDKTMRLWNFENGQQLAQLEMPAPGIRIVLRTLNENKFQAAVLLHQPEECIGIYEITKTTSEQWDINESTILSFPSSVIVNNLCFVNERLFVAGIEDNHFTLQSNTLNNATFSANWIEMVEEHFKDETWIPEDVSMWFKKRYDNVTDYLERKKRRIEERQKQ